MKYLIKARLEVHGRVEKHDVIGAIFGQTENLLGSDFNLEALQNKDKIGRVYVDIKYHGSKTVGTIQIPSNLDRVETAILAAMLETVDRIGPYQAKIVVEEIKDLRQEKIKKIIERSKELIRQMKETEPDLKELIREILKSEEKPKQVKVIEYGPEKLPAAPGVDKSDTIIIVEGRADVINLMKYGYDNVIAIGGAREHTPKTIIELAKKKKAIAFVDGDRGGDLILKTLLSEADIDYVARAPKGMEVEHLTGKEIAAALKQMVPASAVKKQIGLEKEEAAKPEEKKEEAEEKAEEKKPVVEEKKEAVVEEKREEKKEAVSGEAKAVQETKTGAVEPSLVAVIPKEKIVEIINSLKGTLEAVFFDSQWNEIKRVRVRDLFNEIKNLENNTVYAIVFDGIITQRLMDAAAEKGVKILIGARLGAKIGSKPEGITYLTFNDLV
ncbi:MAG: DNA primase [Desulfurococcales archaeon]|nr:DNA primase [Desulfurococcales archaeon]